LAENAEAAARELGIEFEVEKVTDVVRFAELGIIMTPGLIVDGVVKASGKVLSPAEIREFLR
jgi:small redox-active disulfide protein 2